MNIALVSQSVSPGILIFRKGLILHLVAQGHNVFAYANDYDEFTRNIVRDLGAVPVDHSISRSGFNLLKESAEVFRLSRSFRKLGIDAVFSFFLKPTIFATLAAKLGGVRRTVVMLEGLGFVYTEGPSGFGLKKRCLQLLHGMLVTLSYSFADRILFLNEDDFGDLSRFAFLSDRKVGVFGPIGLSIDEFPWVPPSKIQSIRFVFVGRLLRDKGIVEFIGAAKAVREVFPSCEFIVVGDIDPENPASLSENDVQMAKSEGGVAFVGHTSEVNKWFGYSHVVVLPSYREGFPRVLQEAMSVGRAIVATDVPGCREVVTDGFNGFLVPPFNQERLADSLIYFASNRSQIVEMGLHSREIALAKFDEKNINPRLELEITGRQG